jgi:hypothetical protein
MCKKSAFIAVCAACFVLYPSAAPARFVPKWTYDQLLDKADLVVLAVPVRTEPADDKPPTHSWPRELVPQNTTLKVRWALKGKAEGEQIKVLHFKFGEPKKGVDSERAGFLSEMTGSPRLVAFRTEPVTVKVGEKTRVLPAPEYLLFLKRREDGRYEPVSGRTDPALSIREVSMPPGPVTRDDW